MDHIVNRFNQDASHYEKGINGNKKEQTSYRGFLGGRPHAEHIKQWEKSRTLHDQNARRGSYTQKSQKHVLVTNREYRVVRDHRPKKNATTNILQFQHSANDNDQLTPNVPDKSSGGNFVHQKHPDAGNSDGHCRAETRNGQCDSGSGHGKNEKSSGSDQPSLPEEKQINISNSTGVTPRAVKDNSQARSETCASANSVTGVYSSSLDPVHVPSSRSARSVGAIRREVGVVGVRQQSSGHSATHNSDNSDSSNPCSTPLPDSDASFQKRTATTLSTNHSKTSFSPDPITSSISASRPFPASQCHVKLHQQVVGHNRPSQPNKEWKPKSSRKLNADRPDEITKSSEVQAAALSKKLLEVNISNHEHVIIPQHLRVPEPARAGLLFGSFGAGFDSTKGLSSVLKSSENMEGASNKPVPSMFTSSEVGFCKDSDEDQPDTINSEVRTSRPDYIKASAEAEHTLPLNDESLSPKDIQSYPDIGLIQSHNLSCPSAEPQLQQESSSLPEFSAYATQMRFVSPISKMMVADNVQWQGFSQIDEGFSSNVADNKSLCSVSMIHQQPPLSQLSPQVNMSHYSNFFPYRQVFPFYVPQMMIPNYLNNSSHSHPSGGSNYVMMPGGSQQLASGGIKYGASQYKPVQTVNPAAAFASYNNPSGYAVNMMESAAGMEDISGINYKDNVYNPQPDVDMWIQTPRDLTSLQSTPYYNLAGQAAGMQPSVHPAYLPAAAAAAAAANPSINASAFQSSHMQFPGPYHPSQPGSFSGPTNHIVHQQVPAGHAGNPAVGMVAAPTAQVGTYHQQTQVGAYHQQSQVCGNHGWSNNF